MSQHRREVKIHEYDRGCSRHVHVLNHDKLWKSLMWAHLRTMRPLKNGSTLTPGSREDRHWTDSCSDTHMTSAS